MGRVGIGAKNNISENDVAQLNFLSCRTSSSPITITNYRYNLPSILKHCVCERRQVELFTRYVFYPRFLAARHTVPTTDRLPLSVLVCVSITYPLCSSFLPSFWWIKMGRFNAFTSCLRINYSITIGSIVMKF